MTRLLGVESRLLFPGNQSIQRPARWPPGFPRDCRQDLHVRTAPAVNSRECTGIRLFSRLLRRGWEERPGHTVRDRVVVYEVMTDDLEPNHHRPVLIRS